MSEAKVEKDQVVALSYTLHDAQGELIDKAGSDDPLYYLHGHRNLLESVEAELEGLKTGESRSFVIPAADGYGEREDNAIQVIERSMLPPEPEPEVGMSVEADFGDGGRPYPIIKVTDTTISIDLNHPMAGVDLHFKMDVVALRNATAEELAHGHAHGPDGHAHHD